MPGIGVPPSKRKKAKNGSVTELEQRQLSTADAYKLFGSDFLATLAQSDTLMN